MRMLGESRPATAVDAASSSAPPLLLITPAAAAGMVGGAGAGGGSDATLDADMAIILAAMLCVLVCALGLNSLIHCFLLNCGRATLLAVAAPAPPPRPHAAAAAVAGPASGSTGGLKKTELRRIPVVVYEAKPGASAATDCAICLGDFDDGEKVGVLPRCHHGFHVQCVDLWLAAHPSCPTCRNSLLEQGHAGDDADGETVAGDET